MVPEIYRLSSGAFDRISVKARCPKINSREPTPGPRLQPRHTPSGDLKGSLQCPSLKPTSFAEEMCDDTNKSFRSRHTALAATCCCRCWRTSGPTSQAQLRPASQPIAPTDLTVSGSTQRRSPNGMSFWKAPAKRRAAAECPPPPHRGLSGCPLSGRHRTFALDPKPAFSPPSRTVSRGWTPRWPHG